jgi:hypothetical protein
MPNLEEELAKLSGVKYFAKPDFAQGFLVAPDRLGSCLVIFI